LAARRCNCSITHNLTKGIQLKKEKKGFKCRRPAEEKKEEGRRRKEEEDDIGTD